MAIRGGDGDVREPCAARCPLCRALHDSGERLCRRCGVPLRPALDGATQDLAAGASGSRGAEPEPRGWRERMHRRARLVAPALASGPPVPVALAQNQAEAELIQGLLLAEGVPSLVRRPSAFDVPDFLAAGPREVLVPAAAAERARTLLGERVKPARPVARRGRDAGPAGRLAALIALVLAAALAASGVAQLVLAGAAD